MRVKTESKRAEVLYAATEVFLERGYEKTAMSDVSDRAGCSKGTLYSYFASKEELYYEVVIQSTAVEAQAFVATISQEKSKSPDSLFMFGAELLRTLYSPNFQALRRMVFASSSDPRLGRAVYERAVRPYQDHAARFIEGAMESGILAHAEPDLAASHFLGLLESELLLKFLLHALDEQDVPSLDAAAHRAVSAFIGAYRAT